LRREQAYHSPVLVSVIKQIFFRRGPNFDAQVAEWTRAPYYDEDLLGPRMRKKAEYLRGAGYLNYPALVHVETQAVCNASCSFCPYPTLARKGTRMSDQLIEKIINDLADIPPEIPFQFAPYKVSDPFVEARLLDILRKVNQRVPHARISLFTNGAALTERKIAELREVSNVAYLNVSLNYCDPQEYERVMGIPFDRTIKRLDVLHEAKAAGEFAPPVRLTRVTVDRASDLVFMDWTKRRYPSFDTVVVPRNDWIGEVEGASTATSVPDAPCHRWFDLSITATGQVAMCCMDGEAQYPKGDVNTQHVLEIYNQPFLLDLRSRLISRRQAQAPCNRCTYVSF
jgi:radical SAM family protein/iron-sulfur cluster protein